MKIIFQNIESLIINRTTIMKNGKSNSKSLFQMKKTSTISLNFFKVIFSDNSHSIFKLLCKQYPFPFFPLCPVKRVICIWLVFPCFGFQLWSFVLHLFWVVGGGWFCGTVTILHNHVNFPFWFARLFCIATVEWKDTFFFFFKRKIQLGNLQFI